MIEVNMAQLVVEEPNPDEEKSIKTAACGDISVSGIL